jgi:hypothetical protein
VLAVAVEIILVYYLEIEHVYLFVQQDHGDKEQHILALQLRKIVQMEDMLIMRLDYVLEEVIIQLKFAQMVCLN